MFSVVRLEPFGIFHVTWSHESGGRRRSVPTVPTLGRSAVSQTTFSPSRGSVRSAARRFSRFCGPMSRCIGLTLVALFLAGLSAGSARGDTTATEGAQFTAQVAVDPYVTTTSGLCVVAGSIQIDWGDGSTSGGSAGPKLASGTGIFGTHRYAEEGTYTGGVTWQTACAFSSPDRPGRFRRVAPRTPRATFVVHVADAPLTAVGLPLVARPGARVSSRVAVVSDADAAGSASDYTAAVSWGDGKTSAASVTPRAGGSFDVVATHTYPTQKIFSVKVAISDAGGATTKTATRAFVLAPIRRPCALTGCLPPLRPSGCFAHHTCIPVPPPPHHATPVPALCGNPNSADPPYSWGPHGGTACTISATTHGRETEYTISNPVVSRPSYQYQGVLFQPGDLVTVHAGGCVQTGGSGATWKRYVNPSGRNSGPDAPRLYHGTISIPNGYLGPTYTPVQGLSINRAMNGVNGSPGTAFQAIEVRPPQGVPEPPQLLTLSYHDDADAYGDNGYYSHDDGNNNQCALNRDGGNAWLVIDVLHGPPLPAPLLPLRPFDLIPSGGFDINGLPLNPSWGWQENPRSAAHHGDIALDCGQTLLGPPSPSCTTDVTTINVAPSGLTSDWWNGACLTVVLCPVAVLGVDLQVCHVGYNGPLGGHINWNDATYTGRLDFASFDDPISGDNDFSLFLDTPPAPDGGSSAGASPPVATSDPSWVSNHQHMEIEFNRSETVANYGRLAWWKRLDDHRRHPSFEESDIGGHQAIVIGTVGLDMEHDGHSELHPVHAIAIREDNTSPPGDLTQTWAFFIRNWGNEGQCSSDQVNLDTDELTLQIPAPADAKAKGVVIGTPALEASGGSPEITPNSAGGVDVVAHLRDPGRHTWVAGEVQLNWQGGPTGNFVAARSLARAPLEGGNDENIPEERLSRAVSRLNPLGERVFKALELPFTTSAAIDSGRGITQPRAVVASNPPPQATAEPGITETYDAMEAATQWSQIYSVFAASNGRPGIGVAPGAMTACLLPQAAQHPRGPLGAPDQPSYFRSPGPLRVVSSVTPRTLNSLVQHMPRCRGL